MHTLYSNIVLSTHSVTFHLYIDYSYVTIAFSLPIYSHLIKKITVISVVLYIRYWRKTVLLQGN